MKESFAERSRKNGMRILKNCEIRRELGIIKISFLYIFMIS